MAGKMMMMIGLEVLVDPRVELEPECGFEHFLTSFDRTDPDGLEPMAIDAGLQIKTTKMSTSDPSDWKLDQLATDRIDQANWVSRVVQTIQVK